jgi:hypothetical protein
MPSPYDIVHGLVSGPVLTVAGWGPALSYFIYTPSAKARDIATWAYADTYLVPTNGVITGTVAENGTPLAYCVVMIYFRANGFFISRTTTDANGAFSFSGLDPTAVASADDGRYFIVALDPAGGVLYNAQIFDRLLAV